MTAQLTLDNVRIHAPIGYFAEEQILGNEFVVTLHVEMQLTPTAEGLLHPLDYTALHETIVTTFDGRWQWMEEACWEAINRVRRLDERIRRVELTLRKSPIPLVGSTAAAAVTLRWEPER